MKRTTMIALCALVAALSACSDSTTAPEPSHYQVPGVTMARYRWYPATAPTTGTPGAYTRLADAGRAPIMWYNIEPALAPHAYDLDPGFNGSNNAVPAIDVELFDDPAAGQWVGIMLGTRGGADYSGDTELEVWVNDFKPDPADRGGILHIDVGRLDEDFFEPEKNEFNDEDYGHDGFAAYYDDTGLDGEFNCCDPLDPPRPTEGGANEGDDRHGDDYNPTRQAGYFTQHINGTERNNRYDTEDLDNSKTFDSVNAFYRFSIPLDADADVDIRRDYADNPYVQNLGGAKANDAWRRYVVDISGGVAYDPDGVAPDLSDVHHIRVWIEDPAAAFRTGGGVGNRRIQIAQIGLNQ